MSGKQAYSDAAVADLLSQYRRTADPRLRDEIVERMRPLVHSVARKFAGREPLEDLMSEGYVGLIRAVDRFTPGRGTRFSTFATHLIAGQIRHYLRDRGHLIRRPAWLQELNARVQRTVDSLEQRLQREPTVAEIAAAANLSEEGVEELLAARQAAQVIRMEAPTSPEDEDYLDVDPEKFRSRDYVTLQLPIEDRIVLEGALERLKELEQKVLYYFFYQDWNQSEIARKLGISCNYTGYVLRNGLKHMREGLPQEERDWQRRRTIDGESVLDAVTGVYNRPHFDRRLHEEISRAQHSRGAVSVCCLQLPEDCADRLLQDAAGILRQEVRRADVVGRTGSSEFGIIFPDTGVVAVQVTEHLAEKLNPLAGAPILSAAATYPDQGRTAEQLFGSARARLFPSRIPAIARV